MAANLMRAVGLAGLSLLLACGAPKAPVTRLTYRGEQRQRHLLILVRGLGSDHRIFEQEGITSQIRERGLPFDVVAPDLHMGYYRSRTFEARLKEDIIDPARKEGYEQIWLAGFSMGGLGSLLYARRHPGDIDGVLLTSPFVGWGSIRREIRGAGGVKAWEKTSGDEKDWQRMLWTWIKQGGGSGRPPVWLGYGEDDGIVKDGPALLAAALPEGHAFSVPGGHTIPTFKVIFQRHLDTLERESAALEVPASGSGPASP